MAKRVKDATAYHHFKTVAEKDLIRGIEKTDTYNKATHEHRGKRIFFRLKKLSPKVVKRVRKSIKDTPDSHILYNEKGRPVKHILHNQE